MNNNILSIEIPSYLQTFHPTPDFHRTFANLDSEGYWGYFIKTKKNGAWEYVMDSDDKHIWYPRWYINEEEEEKHLIDALLYIYTRSSDYSLTSEVIEQYRLTDRARLQQLEERYAKLEAEEKECVERTEEWCINHLGRKLSIQTEINEYRNSLELQ